MEIQQKEKAIFLKKLMLNPYIWMLMTAIALAGFVMQLLPPPSKQLTYRIKTSPLIELPLVDDERIKTSITFSGREVPDLYTSTITFQNTGGEILDFTDISTSQPLQIMFSSIQDVYSIEILQNDYPYANCSYDINSNLLSVGFDYLEISDVVEFSIIHSKSVDITLRGNIKGNYKNGLRNGESFREIVKKYERECKIFVLIMAFFGIIALLLIDRIKNRYMKVLTAVFMLLASFSCILSGIVMIYTGLV